ncbi:hypothetical protein X975_07224, partial [Stegodyphus mimosarum]
MEVMLGKETILDGMLAMAEKPGSLRTKIILLDNGFQNPALGKSKLILTKTVKETPKLLSEPGAPDMEARPGKALNGIVMLFGKQDSEDHYRGQMITALGNFQIQILSYMI